MAYHRAIIDQQIVHGYHDPDRATHNDGRHHQEFLETRSKLEAAANEYIHAMSIIQARYDQKISAANAANQNNLEAGKQ